jgi:molybdenum cofactor synthesis domain-containing protein
MTLEDARSRLEEHWRLQPQVIGVTLEEAAGRVLAEDVKSEIDIPPFDRAAYDGYAVRASDAFGASEDAPVKLTRRGELRAGERPELKVAEQECVEIATGALIPEGADAVVMVEYANVDGDVVDIYRPVAPGENVTRKGSEVRRNSKILEAGRVITPPVIGTLAAAGVERVKVYASPSVAVISSGDELVKPGSSLNPGQVYDVNGLTICDAVRRSGAKPTYLGVVKDDFSEVREVIERGLSKHDVVIISGGSSMGAGDVVPEAVAGLGDPGVLVHGLAQKPGKPTLVAVAQGKPIFCLPGYPVSALMVFDQLVAPYLRQLLGLPSQRRETLRTKLATKILSARGRRELIPVRLRREDKGLLAHPIRKGSGAITSLVEADGYINVSEEEEIVDEGTEVEVMLLGGARFA